MMAVGEHRLPVLPVLAMSRLLVLLLLVCLLLPAMVGTAVAGTRIVASLYPLAMVSMAVARADTEVKVIVPTGASTHDYQLTPGDIEAINGADIIVWAGPEAEPYLATALDAGRANSRPANQQVFTLSTLPGAVLRDYRLDPADTKKYGRDPHLWLSTRNAELLARALGARLDNALAAEHFAAEMQRYRSRQTKRFAPVAQMPLLVAHDAYGYLLDEIGLTNTSALVTEPNIAASARRITDLAQRIKGERIGCMIGEEGFQNGVAPRLFEGSSANLVVLDPQLGGIALTRDSYTLALTHLADTLYGCLVTR